jgi:RNA polymerase sigma factor (sigma-70 family)
MQRELVERARRGDHDAFALLASLTIARLDGAARLILRDPELARDAVQEALVRAWRDLPGLRDPDRFEAWLHRLLVHACMDQLRARRRLRLEVELRPTDDMPEPDIDDTVALRDELDRGFRRLGPDQRAVLALHYYVGLPLPEAAAALGLPLGTAKSRLARALASLRASLGPDWHVDAGAAVEVEAGSSRAADGGTT